LEVRTVFYQSKGVRLRASQSVWREDELLVDAQVTAACINFAGAPRRMPKFVADAVAPHLQPGAPTWA